MNRFDQILSALVGVGETRTSSTQAQRWIELQPSAVYRPIDWDRVSAAVVDRTVAAPEIRLYTMPAGGTAIFLGPVRLNSSSGNAVMTLLRAEKSRWIEGWPQIGN